MKASEVMDEKGMTKYCQQGMSAVPADVGLDLLNEIKGLTTLQEIDLGDGCLARQVHTYEAEVYWVLFKDKKLVHISTDFDRLKDILYSLRRVKFQPVSNDFLKTQYQVKQERKNKTSKQLEEIDI